MGPQRLLLTIDEAAESTGLCRNTIKKALREKELRHGKFGRVVRIKVSDLEAWAETKIEGTMRVQEGAPMIVNLIQSHEKATGGYR